MQNTLLPDPTGYPAVNQVIGELFAGLQSILGSKLVGLYLEGSLILGDFDIAASDIDLVAALSAEIDDPEFAALEAMHAALAARHPEWDDRVEVCYISLAALASVRTSTNQIVNISPGEPIHRTQTRREWIMNWYLTRERSLTLFGPAPREIIEPISQAEFLASVRDHARGWNEWVEQMRGRYAQSYAILTLCRGLYSIQHGDQVSKKAAAEWSIEQYPEWAPVIRDALLWKETTRRETDPADDVFPRTRQFVLFARSLILGEAGA